MGTKVCTKCGVDKPHDQYHRHKASQDGLKSACKVCRNAENRAHDKVRYWSNPEFHAQRARNRYAADPERGRAIQAKYQQKVRAKKIEAERIAYLANKDAIDAENARIAEERRAHRLAYRKAHYRANKDRVLAVARKYREGYLDREKVVRRAHYAANKARVYEVTRAYRLANPHVYAIAYVKRRAAELQATPKWADADKIAVIYAEAARITRETGIAHHVDHSVPLQSKLVCGLHWEENMQILPGSENQSKSNRYWPDMP